MNLKSVPLEEQEELLEEVEEVLLDRVLSRMMEELDEEEAKEVNALLEEDKQEEVSSFFCKRFPKMNLFFEDEIEKINEEILEKYPPIN